MVLIHRTVQFVQTTPTPTHEEKHTVLCPIYNAQKAVSFNIYHNSLKQFTYKHDKSTKTIINMTKALKA